MKESTELRRDYVITKKELGRILKLSGTVFDVFTDRETVKVVSYEKVK
jgi:hypothetical protein